MSRIIKKSIKYLVYHMGIAILGCFLLTAICLYLCNWLGTCISIVLLSVSLIIKINFSVKKRIDESVLCFNAGSQVRNVDYLVIGDMANVKDICEDGKIIVELCAPNRTLDASYEILRHTYSILKKNGKVIISCKKRNVEKERYSVFDIIYFHPVTLKRLNIQYSRIKRIFPTIYEPVGSIQLLLNFRKNYKRSKCRRLDICEFCKVRDIEFEYFEY